MTAKRFTFEIKTQGNKAYAQWYDNGNPINSAETLCGLLNELHEENHQLKRQIGNLEHTRDFCAECCERLEKENEQLKSEKRKVEEEYVQLWMHTYK